jgi:hypothetical protein
MHPVSQTNRERANARACGLVGGWPQDWPAPTFAQLDALTRLRAEHPGAFVAAMTTTGHARVVWLTLHDGGRMHGREWNLTTDGNLTEARAGEPYQKEDETA